MYCTKCGTRNDDSATTCIQCGSSLRPPAFGTPDTPPATPPPPQAPIAQSYTPPPPPPQYVAPGTPTAVVPNYLVQAILVTICCCLPLGIVSIIFASQVNSKLAAGDVAGAMESSRQAKMFAWIALAAGVIVPFIFGALGVLGRLAEHVR